MEQKLGFMHTGSEMKIHGALHPIVCLKNTEYVLEARNILQK